MREGFFKKRNDKLQKIELIEKKTDDLYEWRELFSKKRPVSHYSRMHEFKILGKLIYNNLDT
jgi:hypothetical protein